MAGLPAFPRVDRLAARAGSSIYDALTPRTNEPQGKASSQNWKQYLSEQASQFDPRHPASWMNYAAMFVPGGGLGRGGKFTGSLTSGQKQMFEQLGNVGGGGMATVGGLGFREGQGSREPYYMKDSDKSFSTQLEGSPLVLEHGRIPPMFGFMLPDTYSMIDKFGYSHADPGALLHEITRGRLESKRGVGGPPDNYGQSTIKGAKHSPQVNQMIQDALERHVWRGRDHPNPNSWAQFGE